MKNSKSSFIDGSWVYPHSPEFVHLIDPSTEKPFDRISIGSDSDVDLAVDAARRAFETWSQSSKHERLLLIKRLADIYERRHKELGQTISREIGAPISMAITSQSQGGLTRIQNFIKVFEEFEFQKRINQNSATDWIRHEPVGVCGLITPWNWPMNQIVMKVIPAMAAGCTMVLKPSELTPASAIMFAEMILEAGWPDGVFNLVNGTGEGTGTRLVRHPDVDMISFTGSSTAGTSVAQAAMSCIKRVSLELGGKGANIIFADADPMAVRHGVTHCFRNSGQSCNAPSRMLVERSIYDEAVVTAVETAKSIRVDFASKVGDHIGPVASLTQYNKVQNLIYTGLAEGARLVAGGPGKPLGMDNGYFVQPTVFSDVDNSMMIAQEEIFGPVLCMIPFDREREAIEIANDTAYGLTNYIQTNDAEKARRVARQLRSGVVEINGGARSKIGGMQCGASPFGGMKQSGIGREGGVWGLSEFLEVKAIHGMRAG